MTDACRKKGVRLVPSIANVFDYFFGGPDDGVIEIAPGGPAGKAGGLTLGSVTPRVPKGKAYYNVLKDTVDKGGRWMRKKLDGYLELDPKKTDIPTTTSRGKPFSLKVEPKAKSKWAKVMDLFGNFDDPRF